MLLRDGFIGNSVLAEEEDRGDFYNGPDFLLMVARAVKLSLRNPNFLLNLRSLFYCSLIPRATLTPLTDKGRQSGHSLTTRKSPLYTAAQAPTRTLLLAPKLVCSFADDLSLLSPTNTDATKNATCYSDEGT